MSIMYHVCEDCYISHHYGYRLVNPETEDYCRTASGYVPGVPLWWVGEGDRVTPYRPLGNLPADTPIFDAGYHEEFSTAPCEGCRTPLGGSRYGVITP